MSRGFGSTFGAGTTDLLTTRLTSWPTKFSFSVWANVNGLGGGGFGKIFIGSSTSGPLLGVSTNTTTAQIGSTFSGGSATWTFPLATANTWQHIAGSYDQSNGANVPVVWVNGAAMTLTGSATTGTLTAQTNAYIGNRSDGIRNWDGLIAHCALWNSNILTLPEVAALYEGYNPLTIRPEFLLLYMPLDGVNKPEFDFGGAPSTSITGTRLGTSEPPVEPWYGDEETNWWLNSVVAAGSLFGRSSLNGASTSGPKQFNPSLAGV